MSALKFITVVGTTAVAVLGPLCHASAQPPAPRHAVLAVPSKYPSIQAAIDSAMNVDTVLVAPGRYYENIRFRGKGIVVTSQFARTRNEADIERTIIDGSRPTHPDTGTVVRFVNQEDSTAVIQGFTITGGTGTVWLDAKDVTYFREGGGILCELDFGTEDADTVFFVSLTHLTFDRRLPLAREIAAYQKHRVKRLRRSGPAGGAGPSH